MVAVALAALAAWAVRASVGSSGVERVHAPTAGAPAELASERSQAAVEPRALPPAELAEARLPAAPPGSTAPPPPADGAGVSGRVVDAATGKGIRGVLVGDRLELNRRAMDPSRSGGSTRTDDAGRFAFAFLAESVERLVAVHDDYGPAAAERPPSGWRGARDVLIELERGPRVFGTARDDRGEPLAGILVRVFGPGWPREVAATAGRDGSFRTPAVRPGPIDVVATPPAGSTEAESGFTTEWRSAVIGTEDLRIDLGPGPEHATWRGRVLDERDQPLDAGRLVLVALGAEGRADSRREERRTADLLGGAFELRKLRPGVLYDVTLELDDEPDPLALGAARMDSPGVTERDLRLAGRTLTGVVVDRDTGGPPRSGGTVALGTSEWRAGLDLTKLDAEGRFRFRGLPVGPYDLHVHAEGYAPALLQGVRVGGEAPPPALRIELERGATLVARLAGFAPDVQCELELELDGAVRHVPAVRTDGSGGYEGTWTLPPGVWTVRVARSGGGRAERVVALAPDVRSEVRFLPADLLGFEGRVAVAGSLRLVDRAPVAGARLFLAALDAELPDDDDRVRSATTAADGSFRAEGFVPGRWKASAVLPDGGEVDFDDLVVPAAPPDPVPLELVLPAGRVSGRLVDGTSGAPLAADGPRWWAFLRTADGGRIAAELNGGHTGPAFELRGVPGGRYELLVQARGCFDRLTPPFDLTEGEVLALGEIRLDRSAVLTVEATSADGAPLDGFVVFVQGDLLVSWRSYDRAPGRASWDGLPEGPALVRVSAPGFASAERVVELRVGEVALAAFVLDPE